jgi:NAD(P)-dependent dehydrogenase (short-subunit alcohol dehydrogenase family)
MKTLDQFDIKGRSALITGAASGIGLAYAETMAEAGAKVTLADIDAEGAEREAARLRGDGAAAQAIWRRLPPPLTRMSRSLAGSTSPLPMPAGTRAMASGRPRASAIRRGRLMCTMPTRGGGRSRST